MFFVASALKSGSRRRIDEPQQQQQQWQRKSHCNDGAVVVVVISYLIQIHGPTVVNLNELLASRCQGFSSLSVQALQMLLGFFAAQ